MSEIGEIADRLRAFMDKQHWGIRYTVPLEAMDENDRMDAAAIELRKLMGDDATAYALPGIVALVAQFLRESSTDLAPRVHVLLRKNRTYDSDTYIVDVYRSREAASTAQNAMNTSDTRIESHTVK